MEESQLDTTSLHSDVTVQTIHLKILTSRRGIAMKHCYIGYIAPDVEERGGCDEDDTQVSFSSNHFGHSKDQVGNTPGGLVSLRHNSLRKSTLEKHCQRSRASTERSRSVSELLRMTLGIWFRAAKSKVAYQHCSEQCVCLHDRHVSQWV